MTRTYLAVFGLIFIFQEASAKCSDWEYGQPHLCAKVKFGKLVKAEPEKCFYHAEVEDYWLYKADLKQSDIFQEKIKNNKRKRYGLLFSTAVQS